MCDGLGRLIGLSLRNEFTSGFSQSFSYLVKVISLAEPVGRVMHLGYYSQIMFPEFEEEDTSDADYVIQGNQLFKVRKS